MYKKCSGSRHIDQIRQHMLAQGGIGMNEMQRRAIEYQMKCGILKALRRAGRVSERQYHAAMETLQAQRGAAA